MTPPSGLPTIDHPAIRALDLGAVQKYGIHPSVLGARVRASPTPPDFTTGVFNRMHIPINANTRQAMSDWMRAEGGPSDNPLNTTLGQGGAQGSAIKGYGSVQAGIDATVKTLKNGLYNPVIDAFRASDPAAVRRAVVQSPWSGSHYANTDYRAGAKFPSVPTGGAAPAPSTSAAPSAPAGPTTRTIRNPDIQASLLSALLGSGGRALSASQLLGIAKLPATVTQRIPGAPTAATAPGVDGTKTATPGEFSHMVSMANQIAGHHFNYEWGGGHNPGFKPTSGTGHGSGAGIGYDCSGAISAILHAAGKLQAPMVAQQFMSYGQAGPGGKNDMTIYASPTHVFAEIGGRFFGTSMSNPGGGAGWFQRAATAGYTVRHVSLADNPAMHMHPNGNLIPFRTV